MSDQKLAPRPETTHELDPLRVQARAWAIEIRKASEFTFGRELDDWAAKSPRHLLNLLLAIAEEHTSNVLGVKATDSAVIRGTWIATLFDALVAECR